MRTAERDPVGLAPDIRGTHGRAWRIRLEAARRRLDVAAEDDPTLGAFLIEAPYAHHLWHSYLFLFQHLRAQGRAAPAVISRPGATHQFNLWASDPDWRRRPQIEGTAPWSYLMPMNFAGQFIAADDEAAVAEMDALVLDICAARINPDTDYLRDWVARYGDWMLKLEYREPAGHA